jgi:hypothetical protein
MPFLPGGSLIGKLEFTVPILFGVGGETLTTPAEGLANSMSFIAVGIKLEVSGCSGALIIPFI